MKSILYLTNLIVNCNLHFLGLESGAMGNQTNRREPSVVVIGSGFGGLAAAIRLLVKGYRVTVLERLDRPGGRAQVFHQDGFTFDAGPTIVTAPFLLDELWALAGRRFSDDVELVPMTPFYRIRFHDGDHFDYFGDPIRMREEVKRLSPEDLDGFERFMQEAERCYIKGYEELGTVPFETVGELLSSIPAMVEMKAWQSIFQMAKRHFRSHKLQQVFSFHPLLIGGNPLTVTCVYSLIPALERRYGVHSAMGGTGAIVQAMVRLIQDLGGEVKLASEVKQILVSDQKVRGIELQSGQTLAADLVVSNADAANTYRRLMPSVKRKTWTDQKLARSAYSMGLFVWYFGTNRRYEDLPHHQILMGPRYEGLLRDIFQRKVLSQDFSLYLHRPTATDPGLAPAGCDAFYVLSPVPHLDGGVNWAEQAPRYRDAICRQLEETICPGLSQSIVTSHWMAPPDFEMDYMAYKGAAFGMEPRLLQSAWFRPHNRSEEIENLFMVGAGTHPGAGIPGVLTSAKAFDAMIPQAHQWPGGRSNRIAPTAVASGLVKA